MENIIWTKEELKKINRIILNSANLKYNQETSELTPRSKTPLQTIYIDFYEEIKNLFFIKDRNDINNILNQAAQVKSDNSNPLHFGLIMSLSNIDTNDHTQIFEILKQLISQYARNISAVVKKSIKELENLESLSSRIEQLINIIKGLEDDTNLEKVTIVKRMMDETFKCTNGIEKNEMFISITKKLNSQIKERLIESFVSELINLSKFAESIELKDYLYHVRKNKAKFLARKRNADTVKLFRNL